MNDNTNDRSRLRRRRLVKVAALTTGGLVITGAAFAYWTQSGSGVGTASTTTTSAITVNQTTTVTGLGPGTPAVALTGTFTNNNTSKVYVGTVTATVSGTNKTGCDATDYTITGSAAVNAEIASGANVGAWSGISIAFNDKTSTNQDACKGATVNLSYASS